MRLSVNDDLRVGSGRAGPGAVLALGEQDYCYGCGILVLYVDRIGADPPSLRRLEWVRIIGREVFWDGTEQPRDVMVRVAAIRGPPGHPAPARPDTARPDHRRCGRAHTAGAHGRADPSDQASVAASMTKR